MESENKQIQVTFHTDGTLRGIPHPAGTSKFIDESDFDASSMDKATATASQIMPIFGFGSKTPDENEV